jgi:hypothetical protein
VVSGVVTPQLRIATATKSREISLKNDYDGGFKDRVEIRELRVEFPRLRRNWNPNDSAQITCNFLYSRLSSQKRAAHGAERW